MASAGDSGKIARKSLQSPVSKQGKSDGFFGVYRYPIAIGCGQFHLGQKRGDSLHQKPIVRAASRDHQAPRFGVPGPSVPQSLRNRFCRQLGRRRKKVFRRCVFVCQKISFQKCVAKLFAPCALRRQPAKERKAQDLRQSGFDGLAAARLLSFLIVSLPAAAEMPHQTVDYHISRAGIKPSYLLRLTAGRNDGYIRNATDVESHNISLGITKKQIVDQGNQWRSLAARCHIRGAKICYYGDASTLRDYSGLADLQRAWRTQGQGTRVASRPGALMEHRLTVRPDDDQLMGRKAALAADGERRVPKEAAQHKIQTADLLRGRGTSAGEVQKGLADDRRVGSGLKSAQVDPPPFGPPFNRNQSGIDAIHGSSGNQSYRPSPAIRALRQLREQRRLHAASSTVAG